MVIILFCYPFVSQKFQSTEGKISHILVQEKINFLTIFIVFYLIYFY